MRKMDQYLSTADTLYPDGYERERVFRDAGDMVAPAPFPAKIASTPIGRLIAGMFNWHRKRQGRLALRELSDDLLEDIGVTRDEALKEAAKSQLFHGQHGRFNFLPESGAFFPRRHQAVRQPATPFPTGVGGFFYLRTLEQLRQIDKWYVVRAFCAGVCLLPSVPLSSFL